MDNVVERELSPQWAPELVALSYLISWLGAYTSTQIMIHAKYTHNNGFKWVWTFFASIAFGFCAIWSMHFVGMLACRLDVKVGFNIHLTILSAVVPVVFTFAALATPYASETIESSAPVRTLSKWNHAVCTALARLFTSRKAPDIEAAYAALQSTDVDDRTTVTATEDARLVDEDVGSDEDNADNDDEPSSDHPYTTNYRDAHSTPGSGPSSVPARRRHSSSSTSEDPHKRTKSPARTARHRLLRRALTRSSRDSTPASSSTTTSSSDSSSFTRNFSGLSRETRLRIKALAKDRPLPEFGWQYWAKVHYESMTVFLFVRAVIWAAAIVFMHYCGMWAMELPQGRITWDLHIVALSYVVAFFMCFAGCMLMVHMDSHFGQQMIFSTTAAIGCCSMHYTGMAAATFHSYASPSPDAGYPAFLPVTIISMAVSVCVVSNALLAHAAITARNRMAEMILTKRRLWRIMAEKEAAEQAIELKQQFISVASHEIRTPLHTVNGYCELLARTDLTEEQSLYVSSIQQACHAINVIAGNVLDFSKLDRNNVEQSARPVHMELRKMIEDIAKITEARGIQPGSPGVDVIVWVAKDVPHAVYLDETYAFRILMNLLSNAQKFCDQGYISLSVSLSGPYQLCIKVSDTGCGIPKSFRSALFEPFRQADTSLTRQQRQGTGLGLSIVKHLVQRMSGTVDFESVEGEGTTFIVKLPVTLPSRSPSPTERYIPPADATRRLRVVYRNPRTQEKFIRLWQKYGYVALPGSHQSPAAELSRDVDTIWTDSDTVANSPALRSLMGARSDKSVNMFIVHSDTQDISSLEPELNEGRNVVLVKRPVIMHTVLQWMEAPEERLGAHIKSPKVHFALPRDEKTTSPYTFTPSTLSPIEREGSRMDVGAYEGGQKGEEIPLSHVKSTTIVEVVEVPEKPKVLLVEDNLVNQRLGCRVLEKLGYDVTTANDGRQAIDAIRQTYFACCLMDCQMPVLDGFQATRQIRELEESGVLPDHLPIIALTANVTQESEGECRAAGMDHFLGKPLKMTDLDETMGRLRRGPQRAVR